MRGAAFSLAAAGLLAGCSQLAALDPFSEPKTPAPEPVPAIVIPPPLPEPEPPAPPEPAALLGRMPGELTTLLGAPALDRREPGARMLQFATEACVLDVALYPEGADGPFRARHIAARTRTGEPLAAQDCLAALLPEERWAQLAGSE